MATTKTNWLAVAASVVAGMVVGFSWYGFLFIKQWMAGNGITMDEANMKIFKNGIEQPNSPTPMIINTFSMVFYALAMNWLVKRTAAETWLDGAKVGGLIGLIIWSFTWVGNLFAMRSTELTLVDGSYIFVILTVMGAILGGWQKK
jgi:hypothetical protein